jgi:hypothetical protein
MPSYSVSSISIFILNIAVLTGQVTAGRTGYGWTTGQSCFDSREQQGSFHLSKTYRPTVRPTQPRTEWVPGALSQGKAAGDERGQLPPSGGEVKNEWSYTPTP